MKKYRLRMFIYIFIAACLGGVLYFACINSWKNIMNNKKIKAALEVQYSELLDDQDTLESEVTKLQDPEYVAKYAREKFMYSKEGELIIDMTNNN